MADEATPHLLRGDHDHRSVKLATDDDWVVWLERMNAAIAPVVQTMQQFGDAIGALGIAYCRALDALFRPGEDLEWPWSADAARWQPELLEIEP